MEFIFYLNSLVAVFFADWNSSLGTKRHDLDSNWIVTKDWEREDGVYQFEASSGYAVQKCRENPNSSIEFPKVIHSAHEMYLDGRLIFKSGNISPFKIEYFYQRPSIFCGIISSGEVLVWRVTTATALFVGFSEAPKLVSISSVGKILDEIFFEYFAPGFAFLMLLLSISLYRKINTDLLLAIFISNFCFFLYFGLQSVGFIDLNYGWFLFASLAIGLWGGVASAFYAFYLYGLTHWLPTYLFVALVLASQVFAALGGHFNLGDLLIFLTNLVTIAAIVLSISSMLLMFNRKSFLSGWGNPILLLGILFMTILGANDVFIVLRLYDGASLFGFGSLGILLIWGGIIQNEMRSRKELEAKNQLLEITKRIAHDIRSPLMAVDIGLSEMSSRNYEKVVPIIMKANQRLKEITSGLMTGSHVNLNKTLIGAKSEVHGDWKEIVLDIVREKELALPSSKSIRFIQSVNGRIEQSEQVSVQEIKRVLSNLVDNSIEAIEKNGTIEIKVSAAESRTKIEVIDNGRGIPFELLANVGTYGFTTKKENGNGLGLFAAKEFVNSLGGQFNVQSVVGEGTRVVFVI